MAVSVKGSGRRRRYTRAPLDPPLLLTPPKRALLRSVGAYGIASLPQLAARVGPSAKSARRHLRELFDAGLVQVSPVARFALADGGQPNDASLLHGSASNVYTLTRLGGRQLVDLDEVDGMGHCRTYGPKNSAFLAHELAIRDVRVRLELSARTHPDHQVAQWHNGAAAEIDLQRTKVPRVVRPDAWFVYRVGSAVLVGLLEVDRGTEKGGLRWKEKLATYELLFQSGRVREVTGYVHAQILILTPHERRRDHLAAFIAKHASPALKSQSWLAERCVLLKPSTATVGWR